MKQWSTRRHLIIEGCDGSGKDTLIRDILNLTTEFTLHPRASTSLGGPVDDLTGWVLGDLVRLPSLPPQIYNRHPLVSEAIYWQYRSKPRAPRPRIDSDANRELSKLLAPSVVLVVCQPPYHVVLETIRRQGPEAHMPGVYDNVMGIYNAYQTLVWPGTTIRYDYTRDSSLTVLELVRKAMNNG